MGSVAAADAGRCYHYVEVGFPGRGLAVMIRRNHSLGTEEARRRVEEVAIELANRFNLNYAWDGDNLGFYGSGVDGNIAVGDDSIEIRVKLGFALMMLQGAVRQAIESAIDGHLES